MSRSKPAKTEAHVAKAPTTELLTPKSKHVAAASPQPARKSDTAATPRSSAVVADEADAERAEKERRREERHRRRREEEGRAQDGTGHGSKHGDDDGDTNNKDAMTAEEREAKQRRREERHRRKAEEQARAAQPDAPQQPPVEHVRGEEDNVARRERHRRRKEGEAQEQAASHASGTIMMFTFM